MAASDRSTVSVSPSELDLGNLTPALSSGAQMLKTLGREVSVEQKAQQKVKSDSKLTDPIVLLELAEYKSSIVSTYTTAGFTGFKTTDAKGVLDHLKGRGFNATIDNIPDELFDTYLLPTNPTDWHWAPDSISQDELRFPVMTHLEALNYQAELIYKIIHIRELLPLFLRNEPYEEKLTLRATPTEIALFEKAAIINVEKSRYTLSANTPAYRVVGFYPKIKNLYKIIANENPTLRTAIEKLTAERQRVFIDEKSMLNQFKTRYKDKLIMNTQSKGHYKGLHLVEISGVSGQKLSCLEEDLEEKEMDTIITLDVSNSMRGEKLRNAKTALIKFIQAKVDAGEKGVISVNAFSSSFAILGNASLQNPVEVEALLTKIRELNALSGTALYLAFVETLKKIRANITTDVIFLSDGQPYENIPRPRYKALFETAWDNIVHTEDLQKQHVRFMGFFIGSDRKEDLEMLEHLVELGKRGQVLPIKNSKNIDEILSYYMPTIKKTPLPLFVNEHILKDIEQFVPFQRVIAVSDVATAPTVKLDAFIGRTDVHCVIRKCAVEASNDSVKAFQLGWLGDQFQQEQVHLDVVSELKRDRKTIILGIKREAERLGFTYAVAELEKYNEPAAQGSVTMAQLQAIGLVAVNRSSRISTRYRRRDDIDTRASISTQAYVEAVNNLVRRACRGEATPLSTEVVASASYAASATNPLPSERYVTAAQTSDAASSTASMAQPVASSLFATTTPASSVDAATSTYPAASPDPLPVKKYTSHI